MTTAAITLQGGKSARADITRRRSSIIILLMTAIFAVVAARLVQIGAIGRPDTVIEGRTTSEIEAARPSIRDRNGLNMAVDIRVPSLYAEPRRIVDIPQAVAALRSVLPDLNDAWLTQRLTGDRGFVWIRRELTPQVRDRIMALGIPGIGFLTESRRFYPPGPQVAHVVGSVNVDNQGIAGIESAVDDRGLDVLQELGLARDQELKPIDLTIDLRVQNIMYSQLTDALQRYKSIAAAGVVMDARNGEILSLVSLPDFDPNSAATALEEGRFNRITAGNFELGSVVKTVSFAATLDSGAVTLLDSFDASKPVKYGRFTINDYRGEGRILTVPEIFRYSSNVGTIQMVQQLGADNYRDFFSRIGFDRRINFELPEITSPKVPARFSEVVAATASFGHGFSISPMHMVRALAAFVNGGKLIDPTLFPAKGDAAASAPQVISSETSARMRYLLRFNAMIGSGSRMNRIAAGYRVGGKTGTAEKVINGRYGTGKNLNVFITAFPMEAPRYVMLVLLDEAEPENAQSGNTAGWNAGEVSGRIIRGIAPMLGIVPDSSETLDSPLTPPEIRALETNRIGGFTP